LGGQRSLGGSSKREWFIYHLFGNINRSITAKKLQLRISHNVCDVQVYGGPFAPC